MRYRTYAEKSGVMWREEAAALAARGTAVWEAERAACRPPRGLSPAKERRDEERTDSK